MSSLIAEAKEVLDEETAQSSASMITGIVAAIQAAIHSNRFAQSRLNVRYYLFE